MLKVYSVPISLYCAKLRILLRHKALEWQELPPPGGYGSEEYKSLVPAGSLPALDHDGLLISDSEAIAEYLEEVFPEPAMLPGSTQQRAKIRELSRFHDTRLEPSVRMLFPQIAPSNRDPSVLDKNWQTMAQRLTAMEPLLPVQSGPLTLADCGLAITGKWIDHLATYFDFPNPSSQRFLEYLERLGDHKAVADEWDDYLPKLKNWLDSQ